MTTRREFLDPRMRRSTALLAELQGMLVPIAEADPDSRKLAEDGGAWFYLPTNTILGVAALVAHGLIEDLEEDEEESWREPNFAPADRLAWATVLLCFDSALAQCGHAHLIDPDFRRTLDEVRARLDPESHADDRVRQLFVLPTPVVLGFIGFMRWFARSVINTDVDARAMAQAVGDAACPGSSKANSPPREA